MRPTVALYSSRKSAPKPGWRSSYQSAAASNSCGTSGCLTRRRIQFDLNVPNHCVLCAAVHSALRHFTGAPVNDFVPLRLGVGIHGIIETSNELVSEIGPVPLRQGQDFGHFFGSYIHAAQISPRYATLTSSIVFWDPRVSSDA